MKNKGAAENKQGMAAGQEVPAYKVAVLTGTRAEWGLLKRLTKEIHQNPRFALRLLVTGAHLSEKTGSTVAEIEADGVPIAGRIPILRFADTKLGVAETIGYAEAAFAHWLAAEKPDVLVVLGDRYEAFAAATAAAVLDIPVAHISGGDVTLGAQDEFFRHSITKMAAIHFPSNPDSARRLLAMGEAPGRIHMAGGLGDENLRSVELMGAAALQKSTGFSVDKPFLLVTYHPETRSTVSPEAQIQEVLGALSHFPAMGILFTKSNADAGGTAVNAAIDRFCAVRGNAKAFDSLGLLRYLSAMALCAAVVGNSSSGVVETPTLGVPAVNIGLRQQGRPMPQNVISVPCDAKEIRGGIAKATGAAFAKTAGETVSPYNGGATAGCIAKALEQALDSGMLQQPKEFYESGENTPK